MTFIRRQAVTTPVTAIDFTGLTAAYDVYVLEGAGLSVNQDGAGIFLRASLNNGATFDTSGVYYSDMIYHYWNGDTGVAYATSPTATIYQQITHGQGGPSLVALPFDFTLRVYGCGVGERYATFQSYATNYHNTVNGPMSLLSAGWYLGGGGVNAIRLFNHLGGSIVSGSVTMYGMRKT
jgi:hypothetical protein